MPHIVVEQSKDLLDMIAPEVLCRKLFDAARDTGIFKDPSAIKVRIHSAEAVLMGTANQSFLHAEVRLMAGRTDAEKSQVTNALLACLETAIPTVGNLSIDTCDLHTGSYTKRVL